MAQLECPCGYVHDLDPQPDGVAYRVIEGEVHTHDRHATMLHLLGIDHTQPGRPRLPPTDIHGAVVQEILA